MRKGLATPPKPMTVKEASYAISIWDDICNKYSQSGLRIPRDRETKNTYAKAMIAAGFLEAIEQVRPIVEKLRDSGSCDCAGGCFCGRDEAFNLWRDIQGDGQ